MVSNIDSYIDSDDVPSDVEYEMYRVAYNDSSKLEHGPDLLVDHKLDTSLSIPPPGFAKILQPKLQPMAQSKPSLQSKKEQSKGYSETDIIGYGGTKIGYADTNIGYNGGTKMFSLKHLAPVPFLPAPPMLVENPKVSRRNGTISGTVKETQTDFTLPTKSKDCWNIDYSDQRGFETGRYFIPLRMACHNCEETGHLKYDCPKPKKETTCLNCGLTGHWFRECPRELCYNCGYPGHQARECKMPRVSPNKPCTRCKQYGHQEKLCPDIWRQFHSTTSVSQMAHGQPVRQGREMSRKPPSCYNCGRQGHWGFECSKETDNNSYRISQFVVRYDGLGLARQKKRKVKTKAPATPSYSDTIVSDSSVKDAPKKHCRTIPRSKSLAYDLPKKQESVKERSKSLDESYNRKNVNVTNMSKKKSKSNKSLASVDKNKSTKSLASIENIQCDKSEVVKVVKPEQKPKFNKVKEELERLKKSSKSDKSRSGNNENVKKKTNAKVDDPWLDIPKSKTPAPNLNGKKSKPKTATDNTNQTKKKGKKKNKNNAKGTGFKKTCNVFG